MKAEILYEYRDTLFGGHRGKNKMYWPKMKRELEEYVKRCE